MANALEDGIGAILLKYGIPALPNYKTEILAALSKAGINAANAAQTFIDNAVTNAKLTGVLAFIPKALLVNAVNAAIQEAVTAGTSEEDALWNAFVAFATHEATVLSTA